MPELNQKECWGFCEETCQQKAREIITSVNGLIDQAVDGNPAMVNNVKLKVAAGLLENSQYKIMPNNNESVETELIRLGWHKEITSTGAEVFMRSIIDVGGRISRWQTSVVERNQKDLDDFRGEDHIGIIEQP